MNNNYPDDVPAGSPRAPWNQADDGEQDPLICDACDHEPTAGSAEVGDDCSQRWDDLKARPQGFGLLCEGVYISQRCTECGGLGDGCSCDEERT